MCTQYNFMCLFTSDMFSWQADSMDGTSGRLTLFDKAFTKSCRSRHTLRDVTVGQCDLCLAL